MPRFSDLLIKCSRAVGNHPKSRGWRRAKGPQGWKLICFPLEADGSGGPLDVTAQNHPRFQLSGVPLNILNNQKHVHASFRDEQNKLITKACGFYDSCTIHVLLPYSICFPCFYTHQNSKVLSCWETSCIHSGHFKLTAESTRRGRMTEWWRMMLKLR